MLTDVSVKGFSSKKIPATTLRFETNRWMEMKYDRVIQGTFIAGTNRVIGLVDIDGMGETLHVKNTGSSLPVTY